MRTLFLNPQTWDLAQDVAGNIAMADDPYSMAQDACSAIKLVLGEQWYDTTIGVNYPVIIGQRPNVPLMKALMSTAALSVLPNGAQAAVFITSISQPDRLANGQVQVTPPGATTPTAVAF